MASVGGNSYLFVDGASLEATVADMSRKFFDSDPLEIDFDLLRAFAGGHAKVFYYDALPVAAKKGESDQEFEARFSAKEAFLDRISAHAGYHVRSGEVRPKKRSGNEQKMVDVQLAVSVMSFAHRDIISRAAILTSDLDFKPLIDAVVEMGVDVTLVFQPDHANPALVRAADNAIALEFRQVYGLLTATSREAHPIPEIAMTSLPMARSQGNVCEWEDPNYGYCEIVKMGNGFWLLAKLPNARHIKVAFENTSYTQTLLRDASFMRPNKPFHVPAPSSWSEHNTVRVGR